MATVSEQRFVSAVNGLEMVLPKEWYVQREALPDYVYPRQVLSASNYPIQTPASRRYVWDPDGHEPDWPSIDSLPDDGVFLWLWEYDREDGPGSPGFDPPLRYESAEVFERPSQGRWKKATTRRLRFVLAPWAFTLWIWEGPDVPAAISKQLREAIASLRRL